MEPVNSDILKRHLPTRSTHGAKVINMSSTIPLFNGTGPNAVTIPIRWRDLRGRPRQLRTFRRKSILGALKNLIDVASTGQTRYPLHFLRTMEQTRRCGWLRRVRHHDHLSLAPGPSGWELFSAPSVSGTAASWVINQRDPSLSLNSVLTGGGAQDPRRDLLYRIPALSDPQWDRSLDLQGDAGVRNSDGVK